MIGNYTHIINYQMVLKFLLHAKGSVSLANTSKNDTSNRAESRPMPLMPPHHSDHLCGYLSDFAAKIQRIPQLVHKLFS